MAFINAHRLDTSAMPYVVGQMFYTVGSGFVHGASGTGKSYAFLTRLALDVANGAPFMGHDTVQGNVIIALGEGAGDAGIRIKAQLAQHAAETEAQYQAILANAGQDAADEFAAGQKPYTDAGIVILPEAFSMPFANGKPSLELQRFISMAADVRPALVIYDAMADFCGGESIVNDTTANRYSMGIKYLVDQLDCFILGIGHDTEDGKKMLGAGRFKNAADVMIGVKAVSGDGEVSLVTSEKAKYSTKFPSFSYMAVPKEWEEPVLDDFGMPTGETERVKTHVVVLQDEDGDEGTGFVAPDVARELPPMALPAMRTVQPKVTRKRTGIKMVKPMSPEARAARVAELLSVPCHECGAPETAGCNPLPGSNFTTPVPGSDVHVSRAAQLAEVKRQQAEMASC